MTILFAQPYNINAIGFYFTSYEDFKTKAASCLDKFGMTIEEYEIQFLDGEILDRQLFQSWDVHQNDIEHYFEAVADLSDHDKTALIAMGECGYDIDLSTSHDKVTLHYVESLKELAMQYVEEGLYGEISESIEPHIDYDSIARDLSAEYVEAKIGGQNLVYSCE